MNVTEQRLPAGSITRVAIEINHGDAVVRWHEGDEIVVRGIEEMEVRDEGRMARIGAGEWLGARASDVEVELPTSIVETEITVHHGDLVLDSARGRCEARTDHGRARVHGAQGDLSLRLGHGDASVENVSGELRLTTGAGMVSLERVAGPVAIRTGHGDIKIGGGAGATDLMTGAGTIEITDRDMDEVEIKTGAGNVTVDGGSSRRTRIKAGAGSIRVATRLGLGSHDLVTAAGEIELAVPRDLTARIEASTTMGNIHSDLPLVGVGQRGPKNHFGRRLVGSLGEGHERASLNLRTMRGNLRLVWLDAPAASAWQDERPFAPVPPVPPTPPVPAVPPTPAAVEPVAPAQGATTAATGPVSSEALAAQPADDGSRQRAILEAVAAGVISIEEADELLAALARRD